MSLQGSGRSDSGGVPEDVEEVSFDADDAPDDPDHLTLCDWPVLTHKLNLGFNHCSVSPFTLIVNNFILPGLDIWKNDLMSDWRFIVQ